MTHVNRTPETNDMKVPTVLVHLNRSVLQSSPEVDYTAGAEWLTTKANESLFARFGVLTPAIDVVLSPLGTGATMTFDGDELGPLNVGQIAESAAERLASRAPDLVTAPLVEFLLSRLRTRYPQLVAAATKQFSTADLVEGLRDQVARGHSIRNLAGALDAVLSAAADVR